jgi:hypothetical protein
MSKLFSANKYLPVALGLAGFAVAGTVPALAQSFNPEIGTGNSVQFSYGHTAQTKQLAARQNGLNAFALVPHASSASDSSDWSTTGRQNIGH